MQDIQHRLRTAAQFMTCGHQMFLSKLKHLSKTQIILSISTYKLKLKYFFIFTQIYSNEILVPKNTFTLTQTQIN